LNRRLDNAPPEDEKITLEEEAAAQEARDDLLADAWSISHDQVGRDPGRLPTWALASHPSASSAAPRTQGRVRLRRWVWRYTSAVATTAHIS
jgi:hypothetical protein